MKTAISIPDDVFEEAERVAERLDISRSQLYTAAIREFLKVQSADEVTGRLDDVYSNENAEVDPALARAQRRSLRKSAW